MKAEKIIYFTLVLCLVVSFCLPTVVLADDFNTDEIIELEDGKLDNGAVEVKDIGGSGGKYVVVEKRDNVIDPSTLENADISITFNVEESATYGIWIRVLIDHAGKDSFHYRIDNEAWATRFYDKNVSDQWQWLKIGSAPLTKGEHTFSLTAREVGALYDLVYISSGDDTVPTHTTVNSRGKPTFSVPEKEEEPEQEETAEKKSVFELVDVNTAESFGTNEIIEAERGILKNLMAAEADAQASEGQYISVKKAENKNSPDIIVADASYVIDIPESGAYSMWYRAKLEHAGCDTFWFRFDDGNWGQIYNNPEDEWVWASAGATYLEKGKHIMQINYRESGGKFDLFYVSQQNSAPTEEKVNEDGSISFSFSKEASYKDIITDFKAGPDEGYEYKETKVVSNVTELEEAAKLLLPGEQLLIDDGVYSEKLIEISAKGTKDAPIKIAAKNEGKAVFSGNVAIKMNGCEYVTLSGLSFENAVFDAANEDMKRVATAQLEVSASSYCRITNNYFLRCGTVGKKDSAFTNIVTIKNGSAYNLIDHNTFDDPYSMQISVAVASSGANSRNCFNRIENNHFVNVRLVNDVHKGEGVETNGMESIQLGATLSTACLNTVVKDNLFENVIGDGSEIISSKSNNNAFIGNSFIDCDSGLTLRTANGNSVVSNYFENTTWGVRMYGKNHYIADNYMKNVSQHAIYVGRGMTNGLYMAGENIIIENNNVVNCGLSAISLDTGVKIKANDVLSSDIVAKNNSVITNSGVAFRSQEGAVSYSGNKATILYGAKPTQKSDGIEYVGGLNIEQPARVTTESAGTTWKKGVSTNDKYIDKCKDAIALVIGRPSAYVKGRATMVDVNNESVIPVEIDGRTLVPVRFVAENMGYDVGWNESEQKVTISSEDRTLVFVLGSDAFLLNGQEQKMDTYARTIQDRTMVPIRVVSEAFGKNVFWQPSGLIIITPEGVKVEDDFEKIDKDDLRYTDCNVMAQIMGVLGGFEVEPTYISKSDAENFNMTKTEQSGEEVAIARAALYPGLEGDAAHTYDKNEETLAAVARMGQWIEYEFSNEETIKYIYILFNHAQERIAYFDILSSCDGVNYNVVARYEADGKTDGETFAFETPQTTKHIRIVLNETTEGSWSGIKEIKFMK